MSMLDTLRALARTDAVTVPSNEKNEIYEQTPSQAGVTSLNSFVSLPETFARDDPEERAAPMELGAAVPRSWAEGYAALCSMPAPTGFSTGRWHRIVDGAGLFLDGWAANAAACGWSDLDVFGCNPDRPDARFDAMGLAMLLDRCEVIAVNEDGATLRTESGSELRFYRRELPANTVPLWQLINQGIG